MKRAGSTAPDKILAAMPGTRYEGVLGQERFDAKGDLVHGTISLYKYVGGKQTLLDYVRN
jgi:branched-chain amino acid transport system substrate-binding protein